MNASSNTADTLTRLSSFTDFIKVKELAEKNETPFHAVNLSTIRDNARLFKNAIPNSQVFYAIKANPDKRILEELHSEGISFDVASSGEIILCKSIGVPSEKMLFSNTIKKPSEIKYAFEAGITTFAFDNYHELGKIAANAPNSNVFLRICVYGDSKINLNEKFGAMPEEAVELILEAQRKGLKPVGISFHVGIQCLNSDSYVQAIEQVSQIVNDLKKHNITLDFIDLGGGFPVKFQNEDFNLNDYFKIINGTLQKLVPNLKVYLEPGSGIVGNSTSLVFSVIGKALRGGKTWYYVDEGIYSSFIDVIIADKKYSYYSTKKGKTESCVLAGRTCCSLDVIDKDVKLPKLEIGDKILVKNAGTYAKALNTTFNSFDLVKTIYF